MFVDCTDSTLTSASSDIDALMKEYRAEAEEAEREREELRWGGYEDIRDFRVKPQRLVVQGLRFRRLMPPNRVIYIKRKRRARG